jgi:hypothetical protein
MTSYNYDFEGLWFQIYSKVLKLNQTLKEDALDKSQLREVTTSIFIAKSQRGVSRPTYVDGFQQAVLKKVENIKDRNKQEEIYKAVLKIINNNHKETKEEKMEW